MARYRTTFVMKTGRPLNKEERRDHALSIRDMIRCNLGFGEARIENASMPKLERVRKGESKDHPARNVLESMIGDLTLKIDALKPHNHAGQDSLDRRTDRRAHGYARAQLRKALAASFPAE